MADRTVVRQGFLVSLGLAAVLGVAVSVAGTDDSAATPPAPARPRADAKNQPTAGAAAIPIESRPYKIRAWVSVDPRARIDSRGREALIEGWKVMVSRFVGAPWDLEIAEGDGPLATNSLGAITPAMVIPEAKGFDKAWLLRVEPDSGGLSLAGREFDAATARIGLLGRRPAPVLADAPRALLQLALDVFAPSAEIAEATAGGQKIRIQGAMLQAANPIGRVAAAGSVFRPTRIFYKPDGGIQLVTPITKTYLRVESIEGGVALCKIESALGNPFTTKTVGKARMVAVGLKPAWIPTRLRFLLTTVDGPAIPGTKPDPRPAAGYDVIAIPLPNGTPRPVGTTDREGRVVLEPGIADGLVSLRLMAAGIEPLIQFPLMPGEQVEENVITNVDPRPTTVTTESELYALRDEIVDLIAVRHRLASRIKSRVEIDNPNWEEAKGLLAEFKTIPPRQLVEDRLTKLDADLSAAQKTNNRRKIRTATAQKLIADTRALIERYLDDEDFNAYERAYEEFAKQTATAKGAAKALPKAPPLPMGGAAGAGGLAELAPPGVGFRVSLPGTPSESAGRTPDGASEIKSYRFQDPVKGTYVVEFWDYPVALLPEDLPRVLDSERDRLGAAFANAKVVRESPVSIDGQPGKEIVWEVPAEKGGSTGFIGRVAAVNSRIFSASLAGPNQAVNGQAAKDFFASFHLIGRAAGAAKAAAPSTERAERATPASPASRTKDAGGANPF